MLLDDELVYVPQASVSAEQVLRRGDIVVATSSGSKHLVGKSALLQSDWFGSFGAFCAGVRASSAVDTRYLAYFFQSPLYWREIGQKALGVNINNLRRGDIESLRVPLPPMGVQRALVANIEKQFSRLDEAVANLQRVRRTLLRYRASLLWAAAVPSQDVGGYVTIGSLLREPIVNGLSIKESATPTPVRALRLSAMSEDGLNYADHRFLPIEPNKVEDIVVRVGDFFVSRGNGSLALVGRGTTAQTPPFPVIFPDTMMRLRFADADVCRWVAMLWPSRLVRSQIERRVKTTAGIYKIAQPQLASIAVPIPPRAKQMEIVAEVDRRLSIVRGVEAQVAANLKRAQALRQAILAKAFGGANEPVAEESAA